MPPKKKFKKKGVALPPLDKTKRGKYVLFEHRGFFPGKKKLYDINLRSADFRHLGLLRYTKGIGYNFIPSHSSILTPKMLDEISSFMKGLK